MLFARPSSNTVGHTDYVTIHTGALFTWMTIEAAWKRKLMLLVNLIQRSNCTAPLYRIFILSADHSDMS
ncbi:unnamed protein product [Protopolystoma xenopodis]|uniref:Uncharacterized protein n=1 Tax=Protopolystoma xenopodis TaxID=117903 RepID=A0A448WXP2_9PLAT|nr:unnamed protein product [Protopolystoma xenopodis]